MLAKSSNLLPKCSTVSESGMVSETRTPVCAGIFRGLSSLEDQVEIAASSDSRSASVPTVCATPSAANCPPTAVWNRPFLPHLGSEQTSLENTLLQESNGVVVSQG